MMKFSVLMSVYHAELPQHFRSAMRSIWDDQSVRPDEIVLVLDGPLGEALYEEIGAWQLRLGDCFRTVPLERNAGLGEALNIGMQHCTHELVARMDTDDISLPQRFARQLAVFADSDVDVCSAWISEFDEDESEILGMRTLPEKHEEIAHYARRRCPANHPAVMYRKSSVVRAGGYQSMPLLEDYYLWARMLMDNARFYNIQMPLVHMRAGREQVKRRSGWRYAKSDFALLRSLHRMGFLNRRDYLAASCLRVPVRLMPVPVVNLVYRLLRTSGDPEMYRPALQARQENSR